MANDDRLSPEKLEKREAERKAAKLEKKRLKEATKGAEPMDTTEDGPKAGDDIEMEDKEGSYTPPL